MLASSFSRYKERVGSGEIKPILITVSGLKGSGKSTIAEIIKKALAYEGIRRYEIEEKQEERKP